MTHPEHVPAKRVSDSRVTLSQLMQPHHASYLGFVHGGEIMRLIDEVGALACMRHARRPVVTVAVDQIFFNEPIRIGDLVILTAEVSYVGRTSMEVEVQVVAENPLTGERRHTNTAYLVYVALDEHGRPTPVPRLVLETEDQRRRFREAEERQRLRLQRRGQRRVTPLEGEEGG